MKRQAVYLCHFQHVIVCVFFPFEVNKVNELAKKMDKQFAGREGKRPAGGVSILPEPKDDMQDLTVRITPLMGATRTCEQPSHLWLCVFAVHGSGGEQ